MKVIVLEKILRLTDEEATELAVSLVYWVNAVLDDFKSSKLDERDKNNIVLNSKILKKIICVYPNIKNKSDFRLDLYKDIEEYILEGVKSGLKKKPKILSDEIVQEFKTKSIDELTDDLIHNEAMIEELHRIINYAKTNSTEASKEVISELLKTLSIFNTRLVETIIKFGIK